MSLIAEADPVRWLGWQLRRLHARANNLPDPPAPVAFATAAAPSEVEVDAISPTIRAVLELFAAYGIEMQGHESMAMCVARNAFDERQELTEFGEVFFAVFGEAEREAAA
jgi:hypothetical protein